MVLGCAAPFAASPLLADRCQDTVTRISARTSHLEVPAHFRRVDARKMGGEFDPNQYFAILDHLRLPFGKTLDYFYYYDGLGGFPILYVRPMEQQPFATRNDFEAAHGVFSPEALQYAYTLDLQIDDTAEGYLQFIILRIMGIQFYQYWHAAYLDHRIICSQTGLEALLAAPTARGIPLPPDVQAKARGLNVIPSITMEPDLVRVQLVIFTDWGGFIRRTYTINRQFPHRTTEVTRETLIEYGSGVVF